ncbi:putative ATP-citrate synthase subunit 2 [Venturia nashicola]|uniref:General transcription and DNA repair factor IIH subunit TFB4 n=1 Tax=Venturia nashicola TaxID=86259 RepID=A0A4Z1P1T7_9PEZI|nr:putative ATP-citrate synthase subunit 2 [Venturia nashicola]TLD34494.1 putative ATP-citrate synthase subunit 2 [Venturia nashicola]
MDAIDGTQRDAKTDEGPPPSLLTVILDTNPVAWNALSNTLSLPNAISKLLVFINAHLAINHANQIAVIASHTNTASWLYPAPNALSKRSQNGTHGKSDKFQDAGDANKYRPFWAVEQQVRYNLTKLMESTREEDLENTESTQIAGALTMALAYINKQTILSRPPGLEAHMVNIGESKDDPHKKSSATLLSRILILSVSSDLSDQYIQVMNGIFAAQRLQIPMDVMKLSGSTVFLQQASDATGGIYLDPQSSALKGGAGFLQYLMMAYLPDVTARQLLVRPGKGEVDFRAACFCHRNVIDLGYVCSVCLSIFCSPTVLIDTSCLTCGTQLSLPANYNVTPATIQRPKKKKKKLGDAGASGVGTPTAGVSTPAR